MYLLLFPFPQYGCTARLTQPLFSFKLIFGENYFDCGSAVLADNGSSFPCEIFCQLELIKSVNGLKALDRTG